MLNSADLMNQRCLVMGGSGFIGTNLCRALSGRVRILKAFSNSPADIEGVEWIQGDFLKSDDIVRAVEDVDVVFHLISTSTPASSNVDPLADAQQNILQTLRLLEACRAKQVKRVIFISSGGTVYGDAKVLPTPESHPEHPICAYGISKLAIEKYLHLYERLHGITAITLRVSNPYGPYQSSCRQQGVIGVFIRRALTNQPIEIWGDGSVMRDYVYIDDVVDALMRASTYEGKYRIFNVGSGQGIALSDVADLITYVSGSDLKRNHLDARSLDVASSVLDCNRARCELGWVPATDIRSGLIRTLAWFREQQGRV